MRTSFLLLPLLLSVACGVSSSGDATGEDDLTRRAYAYTCTSSEPHVFDKPQMEVTINDGRLRLITEFGENVGSRDRSYKQPANTSRIRFDGFEYGGDCEVKVVVDSAALRGAANAELRVQCAGDGFLQDVYTCGSPHRAQFEPAATAPASPASPPTSPTVPKSAKTWACSRANPYGMLDSDISVQVSEQAIRVVDSQSNDTYEGTRDTKYKSRSGALIGYDDFSAGDDCTMTVVADKTILEPSTTKANLKVRCTGEDFRQDAYSCTPK